MRLVGSILVLVLLSGGADVGRADGPPAPSRLLLKLRRGPAASAMPAFGESRADLGLTTLDATLGTLGDHAVERLLPPAPARGRALAEELGLDRWCLVRFADPVDLSGALATLSADGDVEAVEIDQRGEGASVTPNDPSFGTQWHLKNNAHPGADIHAPDGWSWTTGNPSVIVAILDSGIDWDHPDLASRVWTNPGEIPGNGVDDELNGFIDDVHGWDFVNNDGNPMDDHGHGTNVAGIVGAATNNAVGVAGVDWNCRLLAAKNLDASNSGFYSWWTSSIYYAVNQGAKVLNMSEGGISFSAPMRDAVDFAQGSGALVCVAMMNSNSGTPYYPANYANAIAVGATNDQDRRAVPFCWGGGSSYGPHIELVAPGDWIYSTLWDNTYGYFCGTSQATPQVSAAAALLWALRPVLTNTDVRNYLLTTADDLVGDPGEDTPGFDDFYGYGRLNLDRALAAASIVAVEPPFAPAGLDARITPNPAGRTAVLHYRLPAAGRVDVSVFDLAGRLLRSRSRAGAPSGDGTLELDTSGLGAGVYLVRVAHRGDGASTASVLTRRVAVIR